MKATAFTRAPAVAGVLVLAAGAHAPAAARTCEAIQLKAAGRYSSCSLKANAQAVKKGGTPDASGCGAKFSATWRRAERKRDTECVSSADQAAIQAFIVQCTEGVASALAGGPLPSCFVRKASGQSLKTAQISSTARRVRAGSSEQRGGTSRAG